jgi:GntR family transcriptional regulator/MocR family aminotransferase
MNDSDIPVQLPLTISRSPEESLQQQVVRQIRLGIIDGRLPLGSRLTSIRELAAQLGLSLNTVKLAYQQLQSEGFLETSEARGTYVAHVLPDESVPPLVFKTPAHPVRHASLFPPAFAPQGRVNRRPPPDPAVIDFWPGRTDPRQFPAAPWRQLLLNRLRTADSHMTDYCDATGLSELREAIAAHLGRARGVRCDPSRVLVTSGIQEALSICAKLLVVPGAAAVTEAPCYMGASYVLAAAGARVARVRVDDHGLVTSELPEGPAALIYLTPSHQFPLGRTLTLERRLELLEWAARSGAYVLEDDYDGDFRFESSPLPALASLDGQGAVIYLGTFSKVMGAGLRLGYMVLPAELVGAAADIKSLFSVSHEWLTQAAMADYMASGDYVKRLRHMRLDRRERRETLFHALQRHFGDVMLRGLSGGMHLVWHLPRSFPPAQEVERKAAAAGIRVYSPQSAGADMTGCEGLNAAALVFGYASLTPEEIWRGIKALADAIGRPDG